ncbi:hypothetical protein [Streptomyces phytohabitans]|uniref:hypothetical protein n=1 Tax=Streptomyces phytohabitans TaxID=1150371 RepID=UPI00345BCC84
MRRTRGSTGGSRTGKIQRETFDDEGVALVLADNLRPVVTRLDGMWTWECWHEIEGHVHDLRAANEAERGRRSTERRNAERPRRRVERPQRNGSRVTNSFAGFQRFPEPSALIVDYVARRAAAETADDSPTPWDLGALPTELAAPMPTWLDSVCRC